MNYKSCAFTGHRELKGDFDESKVRSAIEELLESGCKKFYCGMAIGFDLLCCRMLNEYRGKYDFEIVACIPCGDQNKSFSEKDKKLYAECLSCCDERVVLHEKYTKSCMFERNRYMVERCEVLVAYLREETGGTAYTVKYARDKKIDIIYV